MSTVSTSVLLANRLFNVQNHYLNAETADVFFICGTEDEPIPAHKILLAASTEAFNKMFYGTLREGNEVQIVDATPNGFRQFLRYFYFNDLQLSLDCIDELMYLARKYLLNAYVADCCAFLSEQMEAEGILIGYEQSIRFQLAELKKKMEDSIAEESENVFYSEYFAAINRDLLNQVIQIPAVRIEQSKLVFNGCMLWAEAACKRSNVDASVMQNLRSQLGDCFHCIEFSAMKRNEITDCVEKCGDLFTAGELQGIVSMISAKFTARNNQSQDVLELQISKLTDAIVNVSEGSQEELRFVPKEGMLLMSFSVTEFSETDGINDYNECVAYVASVVKITTEKNLVLHKEFFPDQATYYLRESIVLEPHCTYAIQILFLDNGSYIAREIADSADSPIKMLPETSSKFIATLDLKLNFKQ
ncbi:BTB/POZ domain-containing protein 6-A-like [Bradysia coprophila]|uniref:BTB/POZ domain-containing protein 6-A-like n=1 Tax=Bradysia coprophila TaxID=38358 RepID=UPI00187DC0C5|nr:BTB/POZ domain-containing protein 6-A-like [Bradysia coprophila]